MVSYDSPKQVQPFFTIHYFANVALLSCSVESEYELKEGDRVEFRTILMPPKLVEKQAVEVKLLKMTNSKHEKWANFT